MAVMDVLVFIIFFASLGFNGYLMMRVIELQIMYGHAPRLNSVGVPNPYQPAHMEAAQRAEEAAVVMDALMWYDS
jgi:hypothetical protein